MMMSKPAPKHVNEILVLDAKIKRI